MIKLIEMYLMMTLILMFGFFVSYATGCKSNQGVPIKEPKKVIIPEKDN